MKYVPRVKKSGGAATFYHTARKITLSQPFQAENLFSHYVRLEA
jgi:hypothetical protein